jgi:hypothetical protein
MAVVIAVTRAAHLSTTRGFTVTNERNGFTKEYPAHAH